MASLRLLDIERACGAALGGLKAISLIDPNDLKRPVLQFSSPSVEDVELKTGKRVYDISFILTSGSYVDRTVGNKHGDYYETTVAFAIKQIRFDVEQLAERLRNNFFHVVMTYQNGKRRIVINARLEQETNSGGRLADRSGYQFNCKAKREKKMPLLTGIINSGTIDFSGDYHIFFKDVTGTYYHLTVDNYGSLVTTEASPVGYSNVILIDPPFGTAVNTLGALVTP